MTERDPEQVIAFTIKNALPIRTGLARFVLGSDEAATRFQATLNYEVRFGPLGPVVHHQLDSTWNDCMNGLRRHLEHQARAQQLHADLRPLRSC